MAEPEKILFHFARLISGKFKWQSIMFSFGKYENNNILFAQNKYEISSKKRFVTINFHLQKTLYMIVAISGNIE